MSFTKDEKARGLDPDNIPDESGAALHTGDLVATGLARGETTEVIPPAGKVAEVAKALNDAAEPLGLLPRVQWEGDRFSVPTAVADKAKFGKGVNTVVVPEQGATIAQPTVVHDLGANPDEGSTVVPGSAADDSDDPDDDGDDDTEDKAPRTTRRSHAAKE